MNHLGPFLMWAAFMAVDISFLGYVLSFIHKDNHTIKRLARASFIGFAVFLTLGSIFLMSLILNHEFTYSYVTQYSSRDLPLQYLISSFWAGQEGSFLLWVLLSSWLGLFLIYASRHMESRVMIIYNLNNLFLMLLLLKQSPFSLLPHAPRMGRD